MQLPAGYNESHVERAFEMYENRGPSGLVAKDAMDLMYWVAYQTPETVAELAVVAEARVYIRATE